MERHVLVVLAHPDDESMGMGGRIALYTSAGTPVTYLCATRGQMGRHMGKPFFTTRERLREIREVELRDACKALGIADMRFLGLWDKTVEFEDPEEMAARIRAVIDEVKPSLVLTFHPEHGGHQDHCAIGAFTLRAVEGMDAGEKPVVEVILHPLLVQKLGLPATPVDIRPVAQMKLDSVRAHRSQSQGIGGGWAWTDEAINRYLEEFPNEFYMRVMPDPDRP